MGDAIINAFRGLGFWRIGLLVILLAGTAGAVYGIYFWVTREDADPLEEDQQIVTVAEGDLVNAVSISGSLLYRTRESLHFGSGGVVEDVLVEVGEYVEAGQVIATLDVETVATLRQEIDDARLKIQEAEDAIEALLNPHSDLDIVRAEENIVKAEVALRDAEDALEDLLAPPDLEDELARAEADVAQAALNVAKAEDALDKLTAEPDADAVEDAVTRIDSLEVSLENAQRDLGLLEDDWDGRIAVATDAESDLLEDYEAKLLRYLGAEISYEESLLSPEAMLESWGVDLDSLFRPAMAGEWDLGIRLQQLQDDPDTPWSEVTVRGWSIFFVGSVLPTCDEDTVLSPYESCISRELDETWQKLDDARDSLGGLQDQYEAAHAKSEEGIAGIEQSLEDAQTALADLYVEPDPLDVESTLFNISLALLTLSEAETRMSDLEEQLLDTPDPLDVDAKSKAIETAAAALVQAEEDLAALFEPADPLRLALLESQLTTAEIALQAAETRLESATLIAPWSGLLASVDVSKGDDVNRNTEVAELVDPLDVEVDGVIDEIDVLSVSVGDQAAVFMDALPGQTLIGVVSSISAGGANQQGIVTYPIRVRMTVPAGLNIIEGLSAVAEVLIQQERGLLIPVQAVTGPFDAPMVQVMVDGEIEMRAITLGVSDDFWVIATSGLAAGDQVVFEAPDSTGFDFGGPRGGPGLLLRARPAR